MKKRILILCCLILSSLYAYTQTPYTISGIVRDSSGAPLSKATVRVWSATDSMQVLSGGGGNFLISGLYDPSFGIRITMNGYKSYYKNFSIPVAIKVFSLAPIVLQIDYEELQAVVVRQVQPITIKRDTLEYYAGAYSVREGSMLAELMKKLPGVAVNDSVTVMGKKISKVLLDVKLFFGGDVKAALKNLPYDIINNAQITANYVDQ